MNGDGINLDYTDEDGVVTQIDLAAVIAGNETVTTLVDNGDGTMTYTDEDGTVNLINTTVVSGNTLIDDGTVDIDGDGTPDTGVTLQDVIDNINNIVAANETLTTLLDNGNGTFTDNTEEDGVVTHKAIASAIADNETVTTSDERGDGTMT